MILYLVQLINIVTRLLSLLILVHVVLSYFMSPFHPIRRTVDRLVEPMLMPIRRFVPLMGAIDFSPLILLILIQVLGSLLIRLLT